MPTKARRQTERGLRTRKAIMDAATDLVCQHGYSGTSIDMVCSRAKVVKTALYWHFGSKAGLMAALIDSAQELWVDAIAMHVDEAESPLERLERLLSSLKNIIVERSHLLRLVEVVISEEKNLDADVFEAVKRLSQRTGEAIERGFALSLGQELPSGKFLAHTITSLLHGIHRHHLLFKDDIDIDEFFYDMKRTILASVQERLSR